jgi:hypothetical protein
VQDRTQELLDRLSACPRGKPGWREFEDIGIEVFTFLFVPPLSNPKIKSRTVSGMNIRDAIFPNRNFDHNRGWGLLLREVDARMVLVEFKNYDKTHVTKEEVMQADNYLTKLMGRLGLVVCNDPPGKSAKTQRNRAFEDHKKVILFVTRDHLREMLFIKERGEDPADLIVDILEDFYTQYE